MRIQRAPTGKTTWTDVCTKTTAPYSCTLNTATTATPDGGYDFRAIMTTTAGGTVTSATVANRVIDNTLVRGFDVDGINGGSTVGLIENGDRLLLTFSEQMRASTLIPGWTGTGPATVYVRLRDGGLVGGSGSQDVLQMTADAAGLVPTGLGTVNLKGDYVTKNSTVTFLSTATLSTVTAGGQPASLVSIVLGAGVGSGVRKVSSNITMTWSPSATAQDLAGNASSTSAVTESGPQDPNF